MTDKRAAVFLDRDGTLIEDRGDLAHPEQVVFFPQTIAALRRLREFRLLIVTNQSGIARGTVTAEQVAAVNRFVVDELGRQGVAIDAVYCCPHASDAGCECRKPSPHFALRAAAEQPIELARSFMIGDHPSDIEFASKAGARGVYVLTGHGAKHRDALPATCDLAAGIDDAVERIVAIHAARVLRAGKLVALPTETVYGLGGDATNQQAIARIFAVKGRPVNHPLIVHLASADQLGEWAAACSETAARLAARFWPGPLTLIVPKSARVPATVTGGQDTVGLRVPAHPLALAVLREFGGAVAAPSANRFGLVSPTTADHVRQDLGTDVDFIADGGPCAIGLESTIVSLAGPRPEILRPGGLSREELQAALGCDVPIRRTAAVRVSGQLLSHYAPRANVMLVPGDQVHAKADALRADGYSVATLGDEDIRPAALYQSLRQADSRGVDVIVVTLPDETGLGAAVADRLRKAAAPRPAAESDPL